MIFICGALCSGKTTYGKLLACSLGVPFVEVSSIVKQITSFEKRDDLQKTAYLEHKIIEQIEKQDRTSVVVGVRQKGILQAFPDSRYLWIEASFEERLRCFLLRADHKDILTEPMFRLADEKDDQLGLQDVKNFIFGEHS
jgi:shikimate kinase